MVVKKDLKKKSCSFSFLFIFTAEGLLLSGMQLSSFPRNFAFVVNAGQMLFSPKSVTREFSPVLLF